MTVWYVDKNRVKLNLATTFATVAAGKQANQEVYRLTDTGGTNNPHRMVLFCINNGVISQSAYDAAVAEDSGTAVPGEPSGPSRGGLSAPQSSASAPPTTGSWPRGAIVWNTAPSASGPPGWMCVAAGTPGTWKAMANLGA